MFGIVPVDHSMYVQDLPWWASVVLGKPIWLWWAVVSLHTSLTNCTVNTTRGHEKRVLFLPFLKKNSCAWKHPFSSWQDRNSTITRFSAVYMQVIFYIKDVRWYAFTTWPNMSVPFCIFYLTLHWKYFAHWPPNFFWQSENTHFQYFDHCQNISKFVLLLPYFLWWPKIKFSQ